MRGRGVVASRLAEDLGSNEKLGWVVRLGDRQVDGRCEECFARWRWVACVAVRIDGPASDLSNVVMQKLECATLDF